MVDSETPALRASSAFAIATINAWNRLSIAARLVLALSTVKSYVNTIYGKLQVESRTQAVARARALHLLSE